MDVFELKDYRALVRARIQALPKNGYGQLSRLAFHLGVNATLVSQVLSGDKNFTEDQGHSVAEFFEFTEAETIFFLLLIQKERAGSHRLKSLIEKQITTRQKEARSVKSKINTDRDLTVEEQAIYYSDWLYTAVHTLSSIEQFQTRDAIMEFLDLPRARMIEVFSWLLRVGLCREEKGRFTVGPSKTFVGKDSLLSHRHHTNWRMKAIDQMTRSQESDFFFTAPFSVSESDLEKIRKEVVKLIEGIAKRVEVTEPEVMAVIDLDLFQLARKKKRAG